MARENNNHGRGKERPSKTTTQEKKPSTNGKSAPDSKSVKAEMEIRSNSAHKKEHH
jgi:hypothetical protein